MKNGLRHRKPLFKLQLNGSANRAAIARAWCSPPAVRKPVAHGDDGQRLARVLEQHFGLGAANTVDQVDIYWPSGLHQVITPKPADIT
ncbi:MAG: ASPIC/UnbV domain-containing protein [bacterium]|nr:ASPIC/UnbV domain-containing protein [bacterium]